jgi:hypothetical protein
MDESRFLRDRPRTHPNCLPILIALRARTTLAQRKRFFARLHEQSRALGLVCSHALGRCVFFGAERMCGPVHRHQVANWLSDQAEVTTLRLGQIESLRALSLGQVSPLCDPSMTREQALLNAEAFSDLALRVARQWYQWLEGRIR